MYTVLSAASQTLEEYLRRSLASDPDLGQLFDPNQGGTRVVSLLTPQQMVDNNIQGLSLWLYRIVRDDLRLNAAPTRTEADQIRRTPLPVRLYYLMTPMIRTDTTPNPDTEQRVLGKVLQAFHTQPVLRGTDLEGSLQGTSVELNARLEPLSLEEITRVWSALERPYQLSVSYEVTVAYITAGEEPEDVLPAEVVLQHYAIITPPEPGSDGAEL